MQNRVSENNEKRSNSAQRQIDNKRIAKNILLMANTFRKGEAVNHELNNKNAAADVFKNRDSQTDTNGYMHE